MPTPVKEWFTTRPPGIADDDPFWEQPTRWFNRCYEFNGTRVRFLAGDILAETEHESGSPANLIFQVEVALCQGDIPEFYLPDQPKAEYDIHFVSVVFWRWGFYLSVRGKAVTP